MSSPRDIEAALRARGLDATESFSRRLLNVAARAQEHGLKELGEADWLRVAPLLTGEAPARRLAQQPRVIQWLKLTPWLDAPRPAGTLLDELETKSRALSVGDESAFLRLLRRVRQREMLRIGLRDLTRRAPLRVVTAELTELADALVAVACSWWDRVLAPRYGSPLGDGFCVLAMGKYGSRELNYSSDIDVMFVLDSSARHEQASALARAVMRSLSHVTPDGFAFRVDANLRPYGRDGALVASIDEMERYYERAGQTWERAALIKARPCAGGRSVGDELLDRLRPFVFRRTLDMAAVESIAGMKRRIDAARAASPHDDVKLGPGGIREIEFYAQALQLLHGGRQPRLRVRGTLEALDELLHAGLLPSTHHHALADAYVFLRDVEHRLQIPTDWQTHTLPRVDDADAWEALARSMGFAEVEHFVRALDEQRGRVRGLFSALLSAASDQSAPRPELTRALSSDEADEVREKALQELGFENQEAALAALRHLARYTDGAFGARGREKHPELAERLLDDVAGSPDPDLALNRLAQMTPPAWVPGALASWLAQNAATRRLVVMLFASSEALGRDFLRRPELLDALVRRDAAALERGAQELREALDQRLQDVTDVEDALGRLRRFRQEETLRIGLHDLADRLTPERVGRQLAALAETLLERAFDIARDEMRERYGEPNDARLCVLGLGGLGGSELGYESDLDLVFVFDAQGETSGGTRGKVDAQVWATRVVQRLLAHLTLASADGLLYRVDSRLRPSGSQGTLVTSLSAFSAYHDREHGSPRGAALWERQALLRARPVAGDASLGAEVAGRVLEPVASSPAPSDVGAQVSAMRRNLDAPGDVSIDPKKGPGGLLDVEFAAQCLLMRKGWREASTRRALERLEAGGVLDSETREQLVGAYDLLRRVENRLRLMYARTEVFAPRSGAGLMRLARQLGGVGSDAPQRLVRELDATMRRVRATFDELTRDETKPSP